MACYIKIMRGMGFEPMKALSHTALNRAPLAARAPPHAIEAQDQNN